LIKDSITRLLHTVISALSRKSAKEAYLPLTRLAAWPADEENRS
jgi:hypothetical protein